MSITQHAKRLLAHIVGVGLVALTLVWVGAPAHAAACEYGKGVTVVVQGQGFNATHCVSHGAGNSAWSNLEAAGYVLTGVPNQHGALCQINGKPAKDKCWGLDSYWGFFHANGTGQGWQYANVGAMSYRPSAGGWVGFRFQNGGKTAPSGNPVGTKPPASPKPKPSVKPKPKPSAKPSSGSTTQPSPSPGSTGPTASPSASPSATTKDESKTSPDSKTEDTSTNDETDSSTHDVDESNEDDTTVLSSMFTDDDGSGPSPWTFVAVALIGGAAGFLGWRVWQRR